MGPLPNGNYCLAVIDQRSRYPVVAFTSITNATNCIQILNEIFAAYGYPEKVTTDNGPPFFSIQLKDYFQSRSIIHHRITLLWPRANGEANV